MSRYRKFLGIQVIDIKGRFLNCQSKYMGMYGDMEESHQGGNVLDNGNTLCGMWRHLTGIVPQCAIQAKPCGGNQDPPMFLSSMSTWVQKCPSRPKCPPISHVKALKRHLWSEQDSQWACGQPVPMWPSPRYSRGPPEVPVLSHQYFCVRSKYSNLLDWSAMTHEKICLAASFQQQRQFLVTVKSASQLNRYWCDPHLSIQRNHLRSQYFLARIFVSAQSMATH